MTKDTTTEEKIRISKPAIHYQNSKSTEIELIESDDELLRIDFVAKPDLVYYAGWWMQISRETFIRPVGSDLKLTMVKAIGISIAPLKFYFPHKYHHQRFSLCFPLPPDDTQFIDIIEKENAGNTYFNFYGVALSKIRSQPLFIGGMIVDLN